MRHQSERGFSLIELVVVLAIMIILMGIATPTLLRTIRIYQLESATRDVANMVLQARYEAVKRNQRIGTAGSWPWWGVAPARFGVDVNGNGVLNIPPAGREPRVDAPKGVWIVSGAPFWGTWCGVPQGYTNWTWNPNWRVAFTPRGTVTAETFWGSNVWVDAQFVAVFTLWQYDTSEPWWWRWNAVAVTPAGRVRVFKFQRVGPGGGCGPNGEYRWVS